MSSETSIPVVLNGDTEGAVLKIEVDLKPLIDRITTTAIDTAEEVMGKGIRAATTRELLAELRTRSENWAGQRASGYLADWVDDAYNFLDGAPILEGGREP